MIIQRCLSSLVNLYTSQGKRPSNIEVTVTDNTPDLQVEISRVTLSRAFLESQADGTLRWTPLNGSGSKEIFSNEEHLDNFLSQNEMVDLWEIEDRRTSTPKTLYKCCDADEVNTFSTKEALYREIASGTDHGVFHLHDLDTHGERYIQQKRGWLQYGFEEVTLEQAQKTILTRKAARIQRCRSYTIGIAALAAAPIMVGVGKTLSKSLPELTTVNLTPSYPLVHTLQKTTSLISAALTATASATALSYLYYSSGSNTSSNLFQLDGVTTFPTWEHLSIFSPQVTNTMFYAVSAYGMSMMTGQEQFVKTSTLIGGMLFSFLNPVLAQSVPTSFFKTLGGNGTDWTHSLEATPDGGYIAAGGTKSVGVGDFDILLAKFDETGDLTWTKVFGGNNRDYASPIRLTADGGYILTGNTRSFGAGNRDILLAKLDGTGNLSWAKVFGGNGRDYSGSIQPTTDGGYIIVGSTNSFGAGDYDVLLAKFDGLGNLNWAKTLGGNSTEYGRSIQLTIDGGYIVLGSTESFGAGNRDILLAKFDGLGTLSWAKVCGGNNSDYATSILQTTDGGYIITGYTESFGAGEKDVLLAKFDEIGTLSWANVFGGNNSDHSNAILQTTNGDYIITGYTESFGAGNGDLLLTKFSGEGTLSWATVFGGNSSFDAGLSLQLTADNGYMVAGNTGSFGVGGDELLLAKFNANGIIANCSASQNISLIVQPIVLTVNPITPTVQSFNLTIQPWSPTITPFFPILQTHCEYFPPTSSSSSSSVTSSFTNRKTRESSTENKILIFGLLAVGVSSVSLLVLLTYIIARKRHQADSTKAIELRDSIKLDPEDFNETNEPQANPYGFFGNKIAQDKGEEQDQSKEYERTPNVVNPFKGQYLHTPVKERGLV